MYDISLLKGVKCTKNLLKSFLFFFGPLNKILYFEMQSISSYTLILNYKNEECLLLWRDL